MKKIIKDYFPILLMLLLAAAAGILFLTGVLDMERIPELVKDNRVLAVILVIALFLLKGCSAVILYNPLIITVSLIFPLWEALFLNAVGTALTLSVSYLIGRYTGTEKLEAYLSRYSRFRKYFTVTRKYGFVFCFAIHLIGLSMEVLGVIFGMLRIGFFRYLSSSWLGIIPGMICFTLMGNTWDLRSPVFWTVLAVDLILIAFGLIYTRKKAAEEPAA